MLSRRAFIRGCLAAVGAAVAAPAALAMAQPPAIVVKSVAAAPGAWPYDIQRVLGDNAIKDMLAVEDAKFLAAVRAAA